MKTRVIVQVREQTHSCVVAGRQQSFKLARLCLPGPYTFILNAGKDLPKLCLQEPGSKVRGAGQVDIGSTHHGFERRRHARFQKVNTRN